MDTLDTKRCGYAPCGAEFQPKRSTAEYCRAICRVYAYRDRQPPKPRANQDAVIAELRAQLAEIDALYWEERGRREQLAIELRHANRRKAGCLAPGRPDSVRLVPGERTAVGPV